MIRTSTSIIALAVAFTLGGHATGPAPAAAQTVEGPRLSWDLSTWGAPLRLHQRVLRSSPSKWPNAPTASSQSQSTMLKRFHLSARISMVFRLGPSTWRRTCGFYHPGKNPLLVGLDLPFLPIPDLNVKQIVSDAYFQHPAIAAEAERWNAKLLYDGLLATVRIFFWCW